MAAYYGTNATKIRTGRSQINKGEVNGHRKVAYDEYVLSAVFAAADTIDFMKLPVGARVLDLTVKSPDLGGTGTIDVGYPSNGVDAADADAFLVAGDISGQATLLKPAANAVGIGKKMGAETQVQMTMPITATTSGTIQMWCEYIVD